jgi:hypothetical protein
MEPYLADPPYGIDVAGLLRWASELAQDAKVKARVEPVPPKLRR